MTLFLFWIRTLKGSVIAFVVALVLGFVGMGLLGAALYYAAAPVLRLRFPPIDAWQGDWVWPALILVGMAWSVGFLIAGGVNHFLIGLETPPALRWLVYAVVLWGWAVAVWWVVLTFPPN